MMWKVLLFSAFLASYKIVSCDDPATAVSSDGLNIGNCGDTDSKGCGGDPNAQAGCGFNCGRTCSTYRIKDKSLLCPRIQCKPDKCDCKPGYVFDPNLKKCVLPEKCTPTCGLNERFTSCVNGGCGHRNCSQLGKPILCIDPAPGACRNGCICVNGYLRAANGTCVPEKQCGCGGDPNAHPGCGVNCGRTCDTYKKKNVTCPAICRLRGCDCNDGYVFDNTVGKCVLPQNCPPTCDKPNEIYDVCPAPCPGYRCDVDIRVILCAVPPKPGDPLCAPGCRCIDGYAINATGTCVPRDQCEQTLNCTGANEVYASCPNPCPAQKCGVDPALILCAPGPLYGDASCQPSCICIDGYVRNAANECIPRDQCGCGGDPNAQAGCGFNCGRTCSTYQIKDKSLLCPRIQCKPDKCDCKPGYVFDANLKKCVLPEKCTPTCGLNERFTSCVNGGCGHRNCSQLGKPILCIDPAPGACRNGCICVDGYLRAANGTCVPEKQCGCGGDPNAHSGCGVNCGRTCDTYKKKDVACPAICRLRGCDCNDGYVFDNTVGKCVLPQNCPPTCDKPNEIYDVCPAPCPGYRCDVDPRVIRCAPPPKPGDPLCAPGCRCIDGYAINATGTCVPRDQCEQTLNCTGANEVYASCPNPCPAQKCGVDPALILCAPGPLYGDASCQPSCICTDGYVRNAANECIPRDQCGCGGDPNAQAGCGFNCGRTCSTYQIKDKSLLCPRIKCKPDKCDCKPGYVFDPNLKKCVLPKECTPTCGLNERFTSCVNGGCGHRNCSQLGKPILCIDPAPGACRNGCICVDGYLRAANGTCVPEKQCGCGGDPNAHSGCGVNCGRTCDTYKKKNVACPEICRLGGCDCNDGYVFDNTVGKCVLPQNCPPTCDKPNEIYDVCRAPCPGYRCDVDLRVIRCGPPPKPGDPLCEPGCRCIDGYAINSTGTCVPRDQCDSCGGDPNAHSGCGVNCGRTCDTYKKKNVACPLICMLGGCDCNDGYVFDNTVGKCVLPQNCPPTCDKPNEIYDVCPAPCPGYRCDVDPRVISCAPLPKPGDPLCAPGCRCIDGYAINATGTCVPRDQCEQNLNCTGDNEVYAPCPNPCPAQKCGVNPALILCAPGPLYGNASCQPSCICTDGYVRNAANECIPRDQCEPTNSQCTGPNEFLDTCISGCSNQTCETIGQIFHCPIRPAVCRTGCRCNPGFYRNASNICVSESQCPTPACLNGEIWNRCPTVKCDGDNCPKNRNSPQTCPVGIVCDPPRCTCGPLDKRDRKTGKCIKAYTCPPFKCNGPHESYQSCPATCPGEKCSDYVSGSKCRPFKIAVACKPACRCKKGYYRNTKGICVPACQCGPVNPSTRVPVIIEPVTDSGIITDTTAAPTSSGSSDSDAVANLQAGVTDFNGEFLYNKILAENGKNIITSPYSVFTPLVQLALYASGDSFNQLAEVLNVKTKEQIRSAFPIFTSSFDGQTSVNFSTAAIVYCDKYHPSSDAFKHDSQNIVHAGAQDLDFSKNSEAANIINAWVESKTNNRIKDLISPDDLSALTRLVLVNAIYFKGDWLNAFNKNNTKDADFYLSDGTTKKSKLMYQENQFNYGEVPELNCTVLEMFYKGKNFSMVIVLPNAKDGVLSLAKNLQGSANFKKVLGSLSSQKVKVYLPPFTINTSTDLSPILKQVGVTKIFDPEGSGLSGMLKTPEDTYVSKAIQKAFIEVDETGSEAAAANGVVVSTRSMPLPPKEPVVFRADRPFLFYIQLRGTTMFCGTKAQ